MFEFTVVCINLDLTQTIFAENARKAAEKFVAEHGIKGETINVRWKRNVPPPDSLDTLGRLFQRRNFSVYYDY